MEKPAEETTIPPSSLPMLVTPDNPHANFVSQLETIIEKVQQLILVAEKEAKLKPEDAEFRDRKKTLLAELDRAEGKEADGISAIAARRKLASLYQEYGDLVVACHYEKINLNVLLKDPDFILLIDTLLQILYLLPLNPAAYPVRETLLQLAGTSLLKTDHSDFRPKQEFLICIHFAKHYLQPPPNLPQLQRYADQAYQLWSTKDWQPFDLFMALELLCFFYMDLDQTIPHAHSLLGVSVVGRIAGAIDRICPVIDELPINFFAASHPTELVKKLLKLAVIYEQAYCQQRNPEILNQFVILMKKIGQLVSAIPGQKIYHPIHKVTVEAMIEILAPQAGERDFQAAIVLLSTQAMALVQRLPEDDLDKYVLTVRVANLIKAVSIPAEVKAKPDALQPGTFKEKEKDMKKTATSESLPSENRAASSAGLVAPGKNNGFSGIWNAVINRVSSLQQLLTPSAAVEQPLADDVKSGKAFSRKALLAVLARVDPLFNMAKTLLSMDEKTVLHTVKRSSKLTTFAQARQLVQHLLELCQSAAQIEQVNTLNDHLISLWEFFIRMVSALNDQHKNEESFRFTLSLLAFTQSLSGFTVDNGLHLSLKADAEAYEAVAYIVYGKINDDYLLKHLSTLFCDNPRSEFGQIAQISPMCLIVKHCILYFHQVQSDKKTEFLGLIVGFSFKAIGNFMAVAGVGETPDLFKKIILTNLTTHLYTILVFYLNLSVQDASLYSYAKKLLDGLQSLLSGYKNYLLMDDDALLLRLQTVYDIASQHQAWLRQQQELVSFLETASSGVPPSCKNVKILALLIPIKQLAQSEKSADPKTVKELKHPLPLKKNPTSAPTAPAVLPITPTPCSLAQPLLSVPETADRTAPAASENKKTTSQKRSKKAAKKLRKQLAASADPKEPEKQEMKEAAFVAVGALSSPQEVPTAAVPHGSAPGLEQPSNPLKQERDELTAKLKAMEEQSAAAERAHAQQLEQLNEKLRMLRKKRDTLTDALKTAEEKSLAMPSLLEENERLKSEAQQAQTALCTVQSKCESVEWAVAEQKKLITRLKSEHQQFQRQIQASVVQFHQVQQSSEQAQTTLLFLQTALYTAQAQCQSAERTIAEQKQESAGQWDKAQQCSHEQEAKITELKQQLSESQAEAKNLRGQLAQQTQQSHALQLKIQQLENEKFDNVAAMRSMESLHQAEVSRLRSLLPNVPAESAAPSQPRTPPLESVTPPQPWTPRFPRAGGRRAGASRPSPPASGSFQKK